ncbi:hypothetical protein [Catenulispora yoronensis]|uniref:hypothetical protein n=1 Tax=Catenulispora yoronensis TaxID=450799 RepID=UPI0031D6BB11
MLLLSALQAPDTVAGLVSEWNPRWNPDLAAATDNAIRWHGPFRLTPMLRAEAGLPATGPAASLGLAYVAEVRRERAKIGDSRHADRLRRCYPHGLPAGAEAEAWHLVRGLAKRLRGVARLPGGPVHAPHQHPPLPGDTDHAVYSHDMLPWIVLREILCPLAPGLAREVPDRGGYILRHRDLFEVRVGAIGSGADAAGSNTARSNTARSLAPDSGAEGATARLPHALRDRADDAWPHSVYTFCDLSVPLVGGAPGSTPAAVAVRSAAALIAEVTGGVLVDADGFPAEIRTFSARRGISIGNTLTPRVRGYQNRDTEVG